MLSKGGGTDDGEEIDEVVLGDLFLEFHLRN